MDQVELRLVTAIGTREAWMCTNAEFDSVERCDEGVVRRVVDSDDFHSKRF